MRKPISYYKKGKRIHVKEKKKKDYHYYLSADYGKNFDDNFKPEITPKRALELGVFEGKYINDCKNEFPREWFEHAKFSMNKPDPSLNYFKTKSRQSLKLWQNKHWIHGPDVRGWFQWYCRYYIGRRNPEIDKIQIKRYNAFKRHAAQVKKNCNSGDRLCRPRQRQALLQWCYNPFI